MAEEFKKEVQETIEAPKGRAAYLAKYRERFPDAADNIADDDLYDDALAQSSALQGKLDAMNVSNTALAERISADPNFGAFLALVASEGKSPEYAIARVWGKDVLEMEGQALEDFEQGYQDNLKALAKSKELQQQAVDNIEKTFFPAMEKYQKDNNLTDEQMSELATQIEKTVIEALHGIITTEFIDYVYKGMTYDKSVAEAAKTGVIEGRNQTIERKRAGAKGGVELPNLESKTTPPLTGSAAKQEENLYAKVKSIPGTANPVMRRV
jgi:hypothetical protein